MAPRRARPAANQPAHLPAMGSVAEGGEREWGGWEVRVFVPGFDLRLTQSSHLAMFTRGHSHLTLHHCFHVFDIFHTCGFSEENFIDHLFFVSFSHLFFEDQFTDTPLWWLLASRSQPEISHCAEVGTLLCSSDVMTESEGTYMSRFAQLF